jgi:hypothetical protein
MPKQFLNGPDVIARPRADASQTNVAACLVKDVDFKRGELTNRDDKDSKDRCDSVDNRQSTTNH